MKNSYGNTSTTYRNSNGQSIGSSSSYTDSYGNTTTQQRSNDEITYSQRICHQVFSAYKTENGDIIVIIDYSKRAKDLIQC